MPGRPRTRQVRRLRHHRVAHAAHVERRPHMCRSSGMPGPDGGARYSRVDAITQRAPVNRPAGRERRIAVSRPAPSPWPAPATFIRLYVAVAAGLAGRRRRRGQGRVPAADASAGRWPPVATAAGHARRRPSPPRAPGPGLVPACGAGACRTTPGRPGRHTGPRPGLAQRQAASARRSQTAATRRPRLVTGRKRDPG